MNWDDRKSHHFHRRRSSDQWLLDRVSRWAATLQPRGQPYLTLSAIWPPVFYPEGTSAVLITMKSGGPTLLRSRRAVKTLHGCPRGLNPECQHIGHQRRGCTRRSTPECQHIGHRRSYCPPPSTTPAFALESLSNM